MLYNDARNLIRSGDLIAFRGNDWLSRLIQRVTGGSWSHVGIAWCFRERVFLLEAREGQGVGIRALSEVGSFDWLQSGGNWTETIETQALDRLGRSYAYSDAVLVGFSLKPRAKGDICSEYAARLLGSLHPEWGLQTSMSPSNLVELMLDWGVAMKTVTQ